MRLTYLASPAQIRQLVGQNLCLVTQTQQLLALWAGAAVCHPATFINHQACCRFTCDKTKILRTVFKEEVILLYNFSQQTVMFDAKFVTEVEC